MASPFVVIATQNPGHQIGTFPLPESQLDRFLMRLSIGYPDALSEKELLTGTNIRLKLDAATTAISTDELFTLQQQVTEIHVAEPLVAYVQALLEFSRTSPLFMFGLSPRAGIALIQSAKAWALIDGRDSVYPEDIQAVLPTVAEHRLQLQNHHDSSDSATQLLLTGVAIP